MTDTPVGVFLQWLGNRPHDCRMAIAVDGDSLLTDAGVLGKPNIADTLGRSWYPVVFRGNDLAFRMRFRSARRRNRGRRGKCNFTAAATAIHSS